MSLLCLFIGEEQEEKEGGMKGHSKRKRGKGKIIMGERARKKTEQRKEGES